MAQDTTIYVGLDVHKETIAVATAAGSGGDPQFRGQIPNTPAALGKLLRRLGPAAQLQCCYEAGPTGYSTHRLVSGWGIACTVIAPSLIPRRTGDKVKTDRRDALLLARLLRSGDLTAVWVPDPAHEALRDLARARETAKRELQRARHRVLKLLLRLEVRPPSGMHRWTRAHREWLAGVELPEALQQVVLEEARSAVTEAEARLERLTGKLKQVAAADTVWGPTLRALQCLRGVALITAVTLVAELGDLTRFARARGLMSYSGVVPREASSGGRTRRGSITKTGNAFVRFVAVEAAWHYRHGDQRSKAVERRRRGQPAAIVAVAERAERRLAARYRKLVGRGKLPQQAVVAVARELLGFVWGLGRELAEARLAATEPTDLVATAA